MILQIAPIQISSSLDRLPLYVMDTAYLFVSLIAVTILDRFRSETIASKSNLDESSKI